MKSSALDEGPMTQKVRHLLQGVLLTVVLSVLSNGTVQAQILPVTWRVSPSMPSCAIPTDGSGHQWFQSSFDDSPWEAASPPVASSSGAASRVFRGTFVLADPVDSVWLLLSADDGSEVYVNGSYIAASSSCSDQGCVNRPNDCGTNHCLPAIEVTPDRLQEGPNLIAVHVWNASPGPDWFDLTVLGTAPGNCANCLLELGELCDPTVAGSACNNDCVPVCGDGGPDSGEQCDDANQLSGDGCTPGCVLESGWSCAGQPSACSPICGDGAVRGAEGCDDQNSVTGDGCGANCLQENGWTCAGQPSACAPICGDGVLVAGEECDDGGQVGGDGCTVTCSTEDGWGCVGQPSVCETSCGDGLILGQEVCDDGNSDSDRGWCAADCRAQVGPGHQLFAAAEDRSVYVIDIATQTLAAQIPDVTSDGTYYAELVATPNGRLVVSLDLQHDDGARVNLIDTATLTVAGFIDISGDPIWGDLYSRALAVSPDSRRAYVTNGETVFELDLEARAVSRALAVGDSGCTSGIYALESSNDGQFLFASDRYDRLVSVRLSDGLPTCMTIAPGEADHCNYVYSWFEHLAVSPDDRHLFRSLGGYDWLAKLSTKKNTSQILCADVEGEAPIADAIQMSCDGRQLHVLAPNWSDIVTVDPLTLEYRLRSLDLGILLQDEGSFTAITPDDVTLFWSAWQKVSWMDVETNAVTTVQLPSPVGGIALVTPPTRTGALCAPAPAIGCHTGFGSAALLVKEVQVGAERIIAKFAKGPDTAIAAFGNPIRPPCGATSYAMCIYGEDDTLVGSLLVDRAGHRCSESASMCWHPVGAGPATAKGYGFKDTDAGSDGVTKMLLRSGSGGRSKILMKAQNNAALGKNDLPTGIAAALVGNARATMQIVTSDAGCFSAELERVERNDARSFKARK